MIKKTLLKCGVDLRLVKNIHKSNRKEWEENWRKQYDAMPLAKIGSIIDVGANTGQFSAMIKKSCPNAVLYSFEPIEECFLQLEKVLQSLPNATAVRMALGDQRGIFTINKSSFTPSSSFLKMGDLHKRDWPQSSNHKTERVEMSTLDDFFSDICLEPEVLVKIDVQGYEAQVIGGGNKTLGRAFAAVIETSFYELYEGQRLFDEIYDLMAGLGFTYQGNLDQYVSPIDSRILQADSLFLNKSRLGDLK
ncbi:MAG: FkbM family methyltransferase [Acidobacteriia bacterium]|nr:FkbM family methyltransferase [Terriglobia bacterium]